MKIQNQVKIEIVNSIEQEEIQDLKTTKEDQFGHGFGTKSMELVAKEKNGSVLFQSRNHLFTCIIYLPLKIN